MDRGGVLYAESQSLYEHTFVALCRGPTDLPLIEILSLVIMLHLRQPKPRLQERNQSVTQIVTLLTETYAP